MEHRIYRVVSEVFGVPIEEVNDDSSPDNIPTWDSLAHINLILSLESEFNLSLSLEDGMEMLSVALIKVVLADAGATVTD